MNMSASPKEYPGATISTTFSPPGGEMNASLTCP